MELDQMNHTETMPYKDKAKQANYQNQWLQARRKRWLAKNGPCQKCGSTKSLMAHHTDPDQKNEHRVWSWSKERRETELKKCIVLCRKCHGRAHRPPPEHGTDSRYTSSDPDVRCRCCLCKEAHRKAAAAYRKRLSA